MLAWLGRRPETEAAERWIGTLIEEGREQDSTLWYSRAIDLHIAAARARSLAPPVFAELGPTLADRIMASRGADGAFGDILRTAQALSALDMLGAWQDSAAMRPTAEYLIAAQRANGSWPACLAWVAFEGLVFQERSSDVGFASAALTTACCIEALERFLRPRRDGGPDA